VPRPAAAEIAGAKLADDHLASDVREQLAGMVPLLALGRTLVPAVWQLPPRPMGVLARPALDHLLEAIRAAVPLGEAATLSVLELLLARAASPIVVLEPLRAAHLGLTAGAREKLLGQVVQRRIADMRETAARLAAPGGVERRSSTAALLRLVADLDALEGKWPVSAGDRASLAEVRSAASAFVGVGIDSAVCGQILAPLEALAQPDGLSDEGVEQLEETARHTRRLGIAGAKLGLAANADALLGGFLPRFQERIRANGPGAMAKSGLIDQIRIVEILFGSDAAIQLYEELIGGRSKLSAG
jgi:hypothetical protein